MNNYKPFQDPTNYIGNSNKYEDPTNYIGHSNKYGDDLDHIDLDEEESSFDYEEYKSTANSHADILHEYFKHLNHNYQQQKIYNNPNNGNFYSSPSIDRTDNINNNLNEPTSLFAGDIGEESSGIIKRDSNSREEPEAISVTATVEKL